MSKIVLVILTAVTISGCNIGAGTLGSFDPIQFTTYNKTLINGLDTLIRLYPQYNIPEKWKDFDNWSERGYDFLMGRILYLESSPEEMYYVTILVNQISIRAVHRGNGRWLLEKDFSSDEKEKILKRFDSEIISKLEVLTKTKSTIED